MNGTSTPICTNRSERHRSAAANIIYTSKASCAAMRKQIGGTKIHSRPGSAEVSWETSRCSQLRCWNPTRICFFVWISRGILNGAFIAYKRMQPMQLEAATTRSASVSPQVLHNCVLFAISTSTRDWRGKIVSKSAI